MSIYLILSWWSGLSIRCGPDFLRINLGFVQLGLCAFDIEKEMIG